MEEQQKFESWAVVEIMGHNQIAGLCKTIPFGTTVMLQVNVPETSRQPAFTKLLGMSGIFSINPVTRELAEQHAEALSVTPIISYEVQRAIKKAVDVATKEEREHLQTLTQAALPVAPKQYNNTIMQRIEMATYPLAILPKGYLILRHISGEPFVPMALVYNLQGYTDIPPYYTCYGFTTNYHELIKDEHGSLKPITAEIQIRGEFNTDNSPFNLAHLFPVLLRHIKNIYYTGTTGINTESDENAKDAADPTIAVNGSIDAFKWEACEKCGGKDQSVEEHFGLKLCSNCLESVFSDPSDSLDDEWQHDTHDDDMCHHSPGSF